MHSSVFVQRCVSSFLGAGQCYISTCLLWSGEWGVSLARATLQLLLTSPIPSTTSTTTLSPHLPCALLQLSLLVLSLPLYTSHLPTPQQVMGQPLLYPEQRGDWLLQGCQEHQYTLQQWATAQPVPLPLRHHQWLQKEEECLHTEVSMMIFFFHHFPMTMAAVQIRLKLYSKYGHILLCWMCWFFIAYFCNY